MTSEELNEAIVGLDKMKNLPSVQAVERIELHPSERVPIDFVVPAGVSKVQALFDSNSDTGKKIFYWGWFWRMVDFDQPITLAWSEDGLTGFCENNKWYYPTVSLSVEQSKELRELCEYAAESPSAESVAAVNTFMSNCKPEDWKQRATAAREEVDEMMKNLNK